MTDTFITKDTLCGMPDRQPFLKIIFVFKYFLISIVSLLFLAFPNIDQVDVKVCGAYNVYKS